MASASRIMIRDHSLCPSIIPPNICPSIAYPEVPELGAEFMHLAKDWRHWSIVAMLLVT